MRNVRLVIAFAIHYGLASLPVGVNDRLLRLPCDDCVCSTVAGPGAQVDGQRNPLLGH